MYNWGFYVVSKYLILFVSYFLCFPGLSHHKSLAKKIMAKRGSAGEKLSQQAVP